MLAANKFTRHSDFKNEQAIFHHERFSPVLKKGRGKNAAALRIP